MITTHIFVINIPMHDPKLCELYKHTFASKDNCIVKKDHCIHCGAKKQ